MIIRAMSDTTLLPQWGLIRAEGADAAKFLHGQLTHDVALLGLGEARLASFCSPQGRVLASFVLFKRSATDLLLACHRDVLPTVLKRLQMFVMRAQCKLSDATEAFDLVGLTGDAATSAAAALSLPAATWAKVDVALADGHVAHAVRLPGSALPRVLWCALPGTPLPAGLPAPVTDTAAWNWAEVQSGVALVGLATTGLLVPQMLNHESVGGVNFKKGCYPGQEVVARSQFRGILKRRTFRLAADAPFTVGQPVFHSGDAEQDCGTVVAAAPGPDGRWQALASLQVAATQGGSLHLGTPDGPVLTLLTLPYALLQDI